MERIWTKHKKISLDYARDKNTTLKPKVFVAMSGGVDSSVTAALLKEQGYEVVGCHLRCFNIDGCAERDAEDARRVAEQLGIPFYTFDLEEEYKEKVVDYMVKGYKAGITPNPDVMCNKEIKFGFFLKRALALDADYIATGHYVKIRTFVNSRQIRYSLMTAQDKNKDQSYFLWTLRQKELKHCLFPIGEYTKPEVRKLAKKYGLLTAEKKDSQGICFLGKVQLADFLQQYIPAKKGVVVAQDGTPIGEHRGAAFYTVGQRHGLRMQSEKRKAKNIQPYYVVEKKINENKLVAVEGPAHPALYKKEVVVTDVNFINPNPSTLNPLPLYARIRYRQPLTQATLSRNPSTNSEFHLVFDKAQKFIAPGQSAVFYDKSGILLGGGIIA